MYDILEVINNINNVYSNNNSLSILKDYERVFDELDLYVFEHWEDGELVIGPIVDRHWITCSFMWPLSKMPNPMGAKLLFDYGCHVSYKEDVLVRPRKIRSPSDYRPNSKKGMLDEHPVWIVEIMMPKKLILDIFRGYMDHLVDEITPANNQKADELAPQEVEQMAASPNMPPAPTGMSPGVPQ